MSEGVSSVPASLAPGNGPDHKTVDTATAPAADSVEPSSTPATVNGNGNGNLQASLVNAKDTVVNTASSTLSSISNSQAVQDIKNGPVAQNVQAEANKTTSEFKDLYTTRTIPSEPAATGQPLTQYHSMFYRLLSWENPRATAITFVGTIFFIFSARYLNFLRYAFKFAYFILGITASLEVAGKLLFDDGLASKMRPRKYWTIPRESLERSLDDIEQLLNFFVIESQRILYAENVYATIGVFIAALVSYFLIKLVPFWGLSLIATCVAYLGPLVYVKNREAIDSGLEQVGDVVSSQAAQLKNMTAEHTGKATESIRAYAGEYTSKAQEYMHSKKQDVNTSSVSSPDFPVAPKDEPIETKPATVATPDTIKQEPVPAN